MRGQDESSDPTQSGSEGQDAGFRPVANAFGPQAAGFRTFHLALRGLTGGFGNHARPFGRGVRGFGGLARGFGGLRSWGRLTWGHVFEPTRLGSEPEAVAIRDS